MHVQSNTLLLANVFEHFRNMCLKIYELEPAKNFSAPWLTWQVGVKKTKVKLDLLADINVLLMVEKGIRGRITHSIYWYAKDNNKYKKDYDKNKELSYLQYLDVNNLYGWAMLQKLPVNNFQRIEESSQFNEDLTNNYNVESNEKYFVEVNVQYPENVHNIYNDLPFLPKRIKIEQPKILQLIYMIKLNIETSIK